MGFYDTVFEVIDLRSFSNLWFWIVLGVIWSMSSHSVLGVPWDMVARARRRGGQAAIDLEDLARIKANRTLFIFEESGLWIVGLMAGGLTALALTGFVYKLEFAQALFLLALPLSGVSLLDVATARRIRATDGAGEAVWGRLRRHRRIVQAIGIVSIFVTATWGMYQNLAAPIL